MADVIRLTTPRTHSIHTKIQEKDVMNTEPA